MENEDILYGGNDEQEGEHLSDMAARSEERRVGKECL